MLKITQYTCLAALILLTGCAQTPQTDTIKASSLQTAALGVENPDYDWWQFSFQLHWPEGQALDFSPHLLIADLVFAPPLVQYQSGIPLWRFHRRAARDKAGHRFSIILYTEASTAQAFREAVSNNPFTHMLTEHKLIESLHVRARSPEEMGKLELTSDPNWPIEIQRSWPYFIMGASQTWLLLIQEHSASLKPVKDDARYDKLIARYRSIDDQINTQWRENGQHAYLHHLSAIFGYQPIRIRSNELKTF